MGYIFKKLKTVAEFDKDRKHTWFNNVSAGGVVKPTEKNNGGDVPMRKNIWKYKSLLDNNIIIFCFSNSSHCKFDDFGLMTSMLSQPCILWTMMIIVIDSKYMWQSVSDLKNKYQQKFSFFKLFLNLEQMKILTFDQLKITQGQIKERMWFH